jgi:3D (Asp-Asp-Asp) domain-containing protein
MIAGLAALALASASPQLKPAVPSVPVVVVADPLGDLIQAVDGAADYAAEILVKATLYYGRIKGMSTRDSLGCRLAPMRTVAVDPAVFPRHSVLFIKETVGMRLPDGALHDGFWYASDVGKAIKGLRVDLFTGASAGTMRAFQVLNLATISAVKVGTFEGCPSAKSPAPASRQVASAN